jgi:hypothetical protein
MQVSWCDRGGHVDSQYTPLVGSYHMMSVFGVMKESVDFHVWSNAVCGLHLQEVHRKEWWSSV